MNTPEQEATPIPWPPLLRAALERWYIITLIATILTVTGCIAYSIHITVLQIRSKQSSPTNQATQALTEEEPPHSSQNALSLYAKTIALLNIVPEHIAISRYQLSHNGSLHIHAEALNSEAVESFLTALRNNGCQRVQEIQIIPDEKTVLHITVRASCAQNL